MEQQDPRITLALKHKEQINNYPRRWASLEIISFDNLPIVRLDIGVIHTNGMKERANASRFYYLNKETNEAYFRVHVHS